jgi:hypothetical protein
MHAHHALLWSQASCTAAQLLLLILMCAVPTFSVFAWRCGSLTFQVPIDFSDKIFSTSHGLTELLQVMLKQDPARRMTAKEVSKCA